MDTAELARFAAYGIEKIIGELQSKLAEARAMESPPVIKGRRARPPKALLAAAGEPWVPTVALDGSKVMADAARRGWSDDPEERSREMGRRMAKRAKPRVAAAKLHPRDAQHPDHAKWLAKLRKSHKREWDALTPEQQKTRMAKALSGRKLKVKLAVAS